MYEMLTGERLFVHAGLTTSADEIYSQPVPQVSRKVPGLPADLDAIMRKALALDPDERYQTAGEFQEALMRCAHRNGLLMSAPELAAELREACGPTDQWRGDDDDEDFGYVAGKRAGTEVYDASDDDEDDAEDELDPDRSDRGRCRSTDLAARAIEAPATTATATAAREDRGRASSQGVELTSIINMIDLESGRARSRWSISSAAPPPCSTRGRDSLARGRRALAHDLELAARGSPARPRRGAVRGAALARSPSNAARRRERRATPAPNARGDRAVAGDRR